MEKAETKNIYAVVDCETQNFDTPDNPIVKQTMEQYIEARSNNGKNEVLVFSKQHQELYKKKELIRDIQDKLCNIDIIIKLLEKTKQNPSLMKENFKNYALLGDQDIIISYYDRFNKYFKQFHGKNGIIDINVFFAKGDSFFNEEIDKLQQQRKLLNKEPNDEIFPKQTYSLIKEKKFNAENCEIALVYHGSKIKPNDMKIFFERLLNESPNIKNLKVVLLSCFSAEENPNIDEIYINKVNNIIQECSLYRELNIEVLGVKKILIPKNALSSDAISKHDNIIKDRKQQKDRIRSLSPYFINTEKSEKIKENEKQIYYNPTSLKEKTFTSTQDKGRKSLDFNMSNIERQHYFPW